MRSSTDVVGLRGWLSVRRVFVASLTLVVLALPGGAPHPVAAQAPGTVNVRFNYDTLPISYEGGKPVLCQGETYKILAQGAQRFSKLRQALMAFVLWRQIF